MKQIKIPDKLYSELRTFCDKQDVPLKDYIEGVLKTSMLFPDGIEIPESFTKAKLDSEKATGFEYGIMYAIEAIIENKPWVFNEFSKRIGLITIGSTCGRRYQCDQTVDPDILQGEIVDALRTTINAAVLTYFSKSNQSDA